jgi:hypothetical protein
MTVKSYAYLQRIKIIDGIVAQKTMTNSALPASLTHVLGQALPAGGVAAGQRHRLLQHSRACAAGPRVREGAAGPLSSKVGVVVDQLLA